MQNSKSSSNSSSSSSSSVKSSSSSSSKYLSKSIIWKEMQQYYEDLGPVAWEQDIVPYQITSNKIIAHLYATLIQANCLDHAQQTDKYETSQQEPLYILELGAGHGKFSFYLCKILEQFNLYQQFNIVYIISDISLKNLASLQQNAQLHQYIIKQQLDFACFNASEDQEIHLINSNKIISKDSLNTNLIVIANYVFDTLSNDAFKIHNQQLLISSIALDYKEKLCLDKLKYKYSYTPIESNHYYSNDKFNQVLLAYQQQLKQGSFLFPVGALAAIHNIQMFSKKSTMFLVADKGNVSIEDFKAKNDPDIASHGSISFMVNFHAIEQFIALHHGISMISPTTYTDLNIACFMLSKQSYDDNHNYVTFIARQVLYDVNPLHLINLCYCNDKVNNWSSLKQILAVLSMSKWDPDLFYDLSAQLLNFLSKDFKHGNLDIEQERDLQQGLNLVYEYFFKLSKEQDLPFVFGNIYYVLENFNLAIKYFKISTLNFEPTVEVWYNLALCYYAKNDKHTAYKYLQQALQLNNKYNPAKKLIKEIAC